MTTNYVKKLDEALTRPSQVDMTIKFGLANAEMLTKIFLSIYTVLEDDHPGILERPASAMNTKVVVTSPLGSILPFKSTTDLAQATIDLRDKVCSDMEFEMQKAREGIEVQILAKEFAIIVPSGRFSPAEIQGYLLEHKRMPEEAIKGAAAWVEKKNAEKKKNKERRKEELEVIEILEKKIRDEDNGVDSEEPIDGLTRSS
jgi:chaperone BCS1